MRKKPEIALILGSGPGAVAARDWETHPFDAIVAINNAWAVRPDWTHHIHPEDFPAERGPDGYSEAQVEVTFRDYVPAMNAHGGVVHIGGTMAYTAGYWALEALQPRVLAFLGCDMVYPVSGPTHFYGTGTADPLRPDPTLRSLEAKAARLSLCAARHGVACVNLSGGESRLVYPRAGLSELAGFSPAKDLPENAIARAERIERELGYTVEDGRYWKQQSGFDLDVIDKIDTAWLTAWAALRG